LPPAEAQYVKLSIQLLLVLVIICSLSVAGRRHDKDDVYQDVANKIRTTRFPVLILLIRLGKIILTFLT
jgi:hypothetical protein